MSTVSKESSSESDSIHTVSDVLPKEPDAPLFQNCWVRLPRRRSSKPQRSSQDAKAVKPQMEGWENQNVFFRWAFPWIQYFFHDLSNETMRFPQFSINVQSWNKYVRFLQSSSIDLTFSILFASKTAVTLIGGEGKWVGRQAAEMPISSPSVQNVLNKEAQGPRGICTLNKCEGAVAEHLQAIGNAQKCEVWSETETTPN